MSLHQVGKMGVQLLLSSQTLWMMGWVKIEKDYEMLVGEQAYPNVVSVYLIGRSYQREVSDICHFDFKLPPQCKFGGAQLVATLEALESFLGSQGLIGFGGGNGVRSSWLDRRWLLYTNFCRGQDNFCGGWSRLLRVCSSEAGVGSALCYDFFKCLCIAARHIFSFAKRKLRSELVITIGVCI